MIGKFFATSASVVALSFAAPVMAQEEERTAPTMEFGTWGVDLSQIDTEADPGVDFNLYVNGKWISSNEIPSDRVRYGAFDMLAEKSIADIETLISELVASNPAEGTTARRIVDAYNAFYDTQAIEAAGLTPLYPHLTNIYSAPDLETLAGLFELPGYASLIAVGVTVDSRNPDEYAASVGFSGMGLPSRDYYLVDNERNVELRAAYMEFLTFMLGQAGYADPESAARAVYDFEHKVAVLEWDTQLMRLPELTYNEVTRDELLALSPEFPLDTVLESGGFSEVDRFLAPQLVPDEEEVAELGLTDDQMAMMGGGLPAMMDLLNETPLSTLKAYMAVRTVSAYSSLLPREIDDANFAFFRTALSGQDEQQPRWKRAIAEVQALLGEQLAALYVERYFPPENKARMDELVANLLRAMGDDLAENEWMTQATLAEAVSKLEGFTPMIGYPEEFETYDGLEVAADTPVANRLSAAAWGIADSLSNLGEPVDRTEWAMLPQTVNAYYMPVFNQIVFPAAILQPPFFNANADEAVNYGAIGAVIGHEIGHGFDDQGSQYDGTGTLRNWWQDEDRAGFVAETEKLAPLLAAYCLEDGETCLQPQMSMGETLGDVVGLQMAYRAYRLSLNGEEAEVIDGLTGDQRFFLGFGQIWRTMQRPESLRSQVISGYHPPADFRINNAVRHVDAWYDAFGITEDDPLYLPAEERVSIW